MLWIIEKTKISLKKLLLILFINVFILTICVFAEKQKIIKVGILLGFTGVIEKITPSMANSIELAFDELSNESDYISEIQFELLRADTTCEDINASKIAANKLITDGVSAIIGAACPKITEEIAKQITIPNNIVIISPADNSNELINLKDNGFVFRTTPSKIRGSEILAEITKDRGIKKVVISHSKDEDNKLFATLYKKNLNEFNIETTILLAHDKNINDYTDHISALTAAGGDAVAIISNINSGSNQLIKSMLDTGAFDNFIFPENMVDKQIINQFKNEKMKKSFGYLQVFSNLGSKKFLSLAQSSGIDASSPFVAESYDAAAVIILSSFSKIYSKENLKKNHIYSVSNKPGIKIYPGEIKQAVNLLKQGKSINYEGATSIEFTNEGDTLGSFMEIDFGKGKLKNRKIR